MHRTCTADEVEAIMKFGEKMLALMAERDLSLRRLAAAVHYDHGYLSKVSRDLHPPSAELAELLDKALDAGGELKDLASKIRETQNHADTVDEAPEKDIYPRNQDEDDEEMERRTLLQALVALGVPAAVGLEALQPIRSGVDRAVGRNEESHLDEWEQTVADYGHTYRFASPQRLMLDLAADLATVQVITARSKKEKSPAYPSWCRVAGGLSLMMAKTLSNLSQPRAAREWWFTALSAAKTSGDKDLYLWISKERLIHGLYEGRPTVHLLHEADRIIEQSSNTLYRGLLGVRAARAQLLSLEGADRQTRAEIQTCNAIFEALPPSITDSKQLSVNQGWPEDRLRYTEAWVYGQLGDRDGLDRAIGRLRAVHPLDCPRYRTQVELLEAVGHVRTGDVTEGVRHAGNAYAALPPEQSSIMVTTLVDHVLSAVPPGRHAETAVTEFRELVASHDSRKALA